VNGGQAAPVVRRPEQIAPHALAPGVTAAEMLGDEQGCRGLHQRRLRFSENTGFNGTAGGLGEAWYVISGSGTLDADAAGTLDADAAGTLDADAAGTLDADAAGTAVLRPGTAVWLRSALGYRCRADEELEVLVITVRAGAAADGPALRVVTLEECQPERTGDREFRVLLSSGLSFTQFAGIIPPGRAPEHQHSYDEVVHVLAGRGVVHLHADQAAIQTEIGPGTSIYLPPQTPHCLENTGQEPLRVLGVFYPAGSPAAKQTS
jgi:mannose-6-phosphate isomerase-like protein (cupin superfamily)